MKHVAVIRYGHSCVCDIAQLYNSFRVDLTFSNERNSSVVQKPNSSLVVDQQKYRKDVWYLNLVSLVLHFRLMLLSSQVLNVNMNLKPRVEIFTQCRDVTQTRRCGLGHSTTSCHL